jgi:hypothetical protein
MKPVPAEVETSLHCSSEYHLARLKSDIAPLIYSLGLRLSKKSGVFYASAETLALYLGQNYRTILRALAELVEEGLFEVESQELFKPTAYRVIRHVDWVKDHPRTCCTTTQFPWSNEQGDPLGVEMYSASGGRVKLNSGFLKAVRGTGLDDEAILAHWKSFLKAGKSAVGKPKAVFFRFLKHLRAFSKERAA